MEIFLLLLDDLDDLLHALRMSLRKLISFCIALSIFASIVISAMTWPWLVASLSAVLVLGIVIRDVMHGAQLPRLRTDP